MAGASVNQTTLTVDSTTVTSDRFNDELYNVLKTITCTLTMKTYSATVTKKTYSATTKLY